MANKRLNAIISIGGTVSSSLRTAIGSTQSQIGRLGESVRALTNRQRLLGESIQTFGRGSRADLEALRGKYSAITREIEKQRAALQKMISLEASRKGNAQRRGEIGSKLRETAAVGTVASLPFLAAAKASTEFQYQLQLIGNTANMSQAEIAGLSEAIMASSKETNQSAVNTQKAIGFLIAAGMEVGLARQLMTDVGKTATATGGEVEDMAKAVFTLNDSLKIAPQDMRLALDTLAVAGKEGNVELKDMAKQLPVLASGFVSLKMEGREAAATMGAALEIARKGAADADEAANNMKNFIAKVMSPETLKKAKKNFNLDLYKIIQDAQKNGGNPCEAAMAAIMKATKGDQKALGELFQDMQVQNFLRPMIQNWDKYREIKAKALKGDGAVDADFAKLMATQKEQLDRIGGAFGRVAIAVGDALGKAFGGENGLADMLDKTTAWVNKNGELVGTLAKVAGGLFVARLAWFGVSGAMNLARGAWLAYQAATVGAPLAIAAIGAAARTAGLGFVSMAAAMKGAGVAAAGAFAAFEVYKLGDALVDLYKAKTRQGVTLTPEAQRRIANGETSGSVNPDMPRPAMRLGSGASPTYTDNSQNTFMVTQQPGQDAKALADEIERQRRQRAGVQSRSLMFDTGG